MGVMVKFNDKYFDELLNSAGVKAMTRRAAEKTLEYAKSHAPVDTGAYRDGLQIEGSSMRTEPHAWWSATTRRPCSWSRRRAISARR